MDLPVRFAVNLAVGAVLFAAAATEYDGPHRSSFIAFMLGGVAGVIPATLIEHRWQLSGPGSKAVLSASFLIGGTAAAGFWALVAR